MSEVVDRVLGIDVVAAHGVPFRVLYIPAGQTGPNPARSTDAWTTVEFYDLRHPMQGYDGQFVSAYHLMTVMRLDKGGLTLNGEVSDWKLDERTLSLILGWLRHAVTAGWT